MIQPTLKNLNNLYIKNYEKLYQQSIDHPEAFWSNIAHELYWFKPWNKTLDWQWPYARWFVGGQTNLVYNALDRWLKTEKANKTALIWVGQPEANQPDSFPVKQYTYSQLAKEVNKLANGLKTLGIKKGDRICLYLPRIPEQFIAMLACAKIGAIHSVVYSGFSVEALKSRIEDAQAKIVITTNAYPYKDKVINSLNNVKQAVKDCPSVKTIIVIQRLKQSTPLTNEEKLNLIDWQTLIAKQDDICSTAIMEANDPAFILYTSGSTGKPKGVVHSHGGYMVGVYLTSKWVFNLEEDDILWTTADAGWITGHSYILYGPLLNGVTTFVYEGTPDYPDIKVWWQLIDKYQVTKFYTAPTAIRMLMAYGDEPIKEFDLSSLKILGSVGEPINPQPWLWFYKNVGREKCPIMDTWWQTETGMNILTPLPSVPLKPGSCFKPFFGIKAEVVDDQGQPVAINKQGYLVLRTPWPAMLLDLWQNPKRYKETYFEKIKLPKKSDQDRFSDFVYFTGDSAKIDDDGYFWIIGRNDDVIKVAGHRLGSAEIEHAIVSHQAVAEAAVIGKPDKIKGETIKAFVILKADQQPSEDLKKEINQLVRDQIGPIALISEIEFVNNLPKTRSGKIMRRILKAKELGLPLGDLSTLQD